ncbi:MAG: hypothetical protein FWC84_03920 [Alphaproteobacteria bacterium]|nr:hypothetical protein [Alphaproteobacteria bacterium]
MKRDFLEVGFLRKEGQHFFQGLSYSIGDLLDGDMIYLPWLFIYHADAAFLELGARELNSRQGYNSREVTFVCFAKNA